MPARLNGWGINSVAAAWPAESRQVRPQLAGSGIRAVAKSVK